MPVVQQPPVAEPAKLPTLDELYRSAIKSLVWVHKLDKTGARMDTTSGFVVAPECVLTAFQSIDMATALEIEFADGTGSRTDEILAVSRLRDWALVKAGTRGVSPLQIGKSDSVVIGEQAIVFSVGSGALRTISAVDIAGRGVVRGFGERIQINPQLPSMAVGGPLLDNSGKVVGIIGGGVAPGMFADPGTQSAELALLSLKTSLISATPIEEITLQPKNPGTTLQSLLESGVLTPPLSKMPVFYFGAVTDKVEADLSYVSRNQFSRKDSSIIIYTMWRAREKADKGRAREKADKGSVSLNIYDANNRLRSKGQPRILELQPGQLIWFQYSFNMNNIEAGLYRMDLLWNGDPIWRASISLVD